jgi:hypothetical protein
LRVSERSVLVIDQIIHLSFDSVDMFHAAAVAAFRSPHAAALQLPRRILDAAAGSGIWIKVSHTPAWHGDDVSQVWQYSS